MEIIVVLRDVGENTEPVGYSHSHHVFGIQQGGYSQLILRHLESLASNRGIGSFYKVLVSDNKNFPKEPTTGQGNCLRNKGCG